MKCAEKILICTHGRFGEELKKSAEMIAGDLDKVKTFSLLPGMTPEAYKAALEQELQGCSAAICLVDLLGGTPFNVASRLSATYPMTVITGLNMAMLIQVHEDMEETSYEELSKCAIEALRESGKIVDLKGGIT